MEEAYQFKDLERTKRLRKLVEYLKKNDEFETDYELARKMHKSAPTMSNILNGRSPISYTFMKDLSSVCKKVDVSLFTEYVLEGKGNFDELTSGSDLDSVIKYFGDLSEAPEDLKGFSDMIRLTSGAVMRIPLKVFAGTCIAFKYNGTIYILKEWNQSFVEYGRAYLIVLGSGYKTIKKIARKAYDGERDTYVCTEDGTDDFMIPKDEIDELFVCIATLNL